MVNRMNEEWDEFQSQIERLEAGEFSGNVAAALPEDAAELLQLTAMLREAPTPPRHEEDVVAQRASLLRLAMAQKEQNPAVAPLPFWAVALAWLRQRPAVRWAALGLVPLLLLFVFFAASGQFRPDQPAEPVADAVADAPPAAPIVGETAVSLTEPAAPAAIPAPATEPEVVAAVAPADLTLYLPAINSPLSTSAETAVLSDIHGLVEVQNGAGEWTIAAYSRTLGAGERLRTGAFSTAKLSFYDGSEAVLGPNSELSLDEVSARQPRNGFRTIVLTQWLGQSEHYVEFRNDNGSRYAVNTPNGDGIARGTAFQVTVAPDQLTRFVVTEGRVDVSNANVTVPVTAGQLTVIPPGQPPTSPQFLITGEGIVSEIGADWIIGGQAFRVTESTLIIGDPKVGDLVYVEGRLLADGVRLADRITLLQTAAANRFSLSGEVEMIGDTAWTVAGQTITVDEETLIDAGIALGDRVRVEGIIQPGGELLAERISRLDPDTGYPFHFTGVVQTIGDTAWTISGQVVRVNEETAVSPEIVVGDVVAVNGRVLPGNIWLAESITLVQSVGGDFEFTGDVQSIDPWLVANISFQTRPWTAIADDIAIGDIVRVRGIILEDGTWVAAAIERLDDTAEPTITLIGIVTSINPWIVNGIQLVVDDNTLFIGNITLGSLVRVDILLRADGTWVATRIQRLDTNQGCFAVSGIVVSFSGNQLVLSGWPPLTLSDDAQIIGNPTPNSVVIVTICLSNDTPVVILIIVIQSAIVPPPPIPPPPGSPPPGDDGLVTICKVPPGNPSARHTIRVAPPAVQAHLGTGSFLGPCP
jgi:mannose-6-phosphate isomerase-like protein (cupin superfamily)